MGESSIDLVLRARAVTQGAFTEVHKQLDDLGEQSTKTGVRTDTLRKSIQAFDGPLNSLGLGLGPAFQGISDLGDASGKTAGQLGAVGTAGLVLGAAIAGWKIGRAVSEFLDLDKAIGNATASMLGWGDVASEEAGAKADTLALASTRAGRSITTLSEAIDINTRFSKDWATGVAEARKKLDETTAAAAALGAEINRVDANNTAKLRALAFELEAKAIEDKAKREAAALAMTSKLWSEHYALRITHGGTANEIALADIAAWEADQIDAAIKAGAATKEFYAALETQSREMRRDVEIDWQAIGTKSIEALQQTAANARATYNEMISGSHHFSREVLAEQLAKTRELEREARGMGRGYVDAFKAAEDAAAALLVQQQALRAEERQRQLESRQIGGAFEVTSQNFDSALRSIITSGGFNPSGRGSNLDINRAYQFARQGYSLQEIIDIFEREKSGGGGPIPPPRGPRIPGFRDEVTNFEGGLAYVHRGELLVNLPRGTDVINPALRGGGGGATYVTNVYVGTALASKQAIARYVQDAQVGLARAQGKRFGETH